MMIARKNRPMLFSPGPARTDAAPLAEQALVAAAWPSGLAAFGSRATWNDSALINDLQTQAASAGAFSERLRSAAP
jgi:hypothetical protein